MFGKKGLWGGGLILLVSFFSAVVVTPTPVLAESKRAQPAFGDPISDEAANIKVEGEAAKCKPGTEGCAVRGYKCYQSAKRPYYINTQSECGVEDDDYVKDKDGNKVCTKDKDGKCLVENGQIVYERKTTMWYLNRVINVVLGIIGVVAVIMIILGGIQYTTSQGDAAKATKARNTILYSVVGLIIALLAFAIVNFVLTSVFK